MKFAVINTEIDKIVNPYNYYFVVKQNGELLTVNHDLSSTEADKKYKIIHERQDIEEHKSRN